MIEKLANNKRHDRKKAGGSLPYKESIGQTNVLDIFLIILESNDYQD